MKLFFKDLYVFIMSLIIFFYLLMTCLFPFSPFGYRITPQFAANEEALENYIEKINQFEEYYYYTEPHPRLAHAVLPLFEQEWLLSNEPLEMTEELMDDILIKLKITKKLINRTMLDSEIHYNKEQREYLKGYINELTAIEERINRIKTIDNEWRIQKNIHRDYQRLHEAFEKSLDAFIAFKDVAE